MLKSFSECEKLLLQLLLLLPLLLLLLLSRLAAVFALCQAFKIVPTVVAATGAGAGMESCSGVGLLVGHCGVCAICNCVCNLVKLIHFAALLSSKSQANVDRINKNIICCDLAQREMQTARAPRALMHWQIVGSEEVR